MPYNLRVQIRDEFDILEQGFFTISKYKACFNALSLYSTTGISTESKRIKKFSKRLATAQFVVLGGSFQSIIENAKLIKLISQDTQEGTKKVREQVEFNGYRSPSMDFFDRGSHDYYGRIIQVAL